MKLRALAAGVLLLALAGCAPGPAPAETAAPEVTATPTPTPTQVAPVAAPGPRTPIGCGEALEGPLVDALTGTAITARADALDRLPSVAVAQGGVLSCHGGSDGASMTLVVAPADLFPKVPESREPTCRVEGRKGQCVGFLVADPWVIEASASSKTVTGGTAGFAAQFAAVLDDVAARLASAGAPLPAWQAPERSTVEYLSCDGFDEAAIAAVLAPSGVQGPQHFGSGDGFSSYFAAQSAAGYGDCGWTIPGSDPTEDTFFFVSWVPGGSWAWSPPADSAPATVAGADDTFSICENGYCSVHALVGDTWVSGSFGDTDHEISRVAGILAVVIQSLPVEETGA